MKKVNKILIIILVATTVLSSFYLLNNNKRLTDTKTSINKEKKYPNEPVAVEGVQKEIIWSKYENQEIGISFRYPPNVLISEGSYNGQNGAVFYVNGYDSQTRISPLNIYLEGSACPYTGVVGNQELIASSTFKHVTDKYDNTVYERYTTDKNGGCYHINLMYYDNNSTSKENAFNLLKSINFIEI